MSTMQRVRMTLFAVLILAVLPGLSLAEPWILAYPLETVVFRYDPFRYEVVGPSHHSYDPAFSLSGEMLWDKINGRAAYEVYQAPGLSRFTTSSSGVSEFYKVGNRITLAVDGFSEYPRQLNDIYVQFMPFPLGSSPDIYVDNERITGLRYLIPRMVVDQTTGEGFYSTSIELDVRWTGAMMVKIIVFADKNGNRVFDGEPIFEIVMEDFTIPTEHKSWGSIKALYNE